MEWKADRSRLLASMALAISVFITPLCRGAASEPDAGAHWRALSEIDSHAALELIEESHPAASAELNDKMFLALLDVAKRHVQERTPKVIDYASYRALMAGLATDLRDGHIWAHPTVNPVFVEWTGMMLSRRDHQWIVESQYPIPGQPDVVGARLQSCDGVDAETWAKERIALFHGNAEVEADLVDAAPWLLLDEGNPFLKRPQTCVFQRSGEPALPMTLYWGGGSQDVVAEAMEKASTGSEVGLDILPFENGYWIDLGTLHAEAADLVAKARQQQAALRKAKVVVIDLRGNGGGNSGYAWELAKVLVGDARVNATDRPQNCGGAYWRVSEGNIAAREGLRQHVQKSQLADYDETTKAMRDALAAGKAFTPALPPCAVHSTGRVSRSRPALPRSLMKGRLIIITDHSCFSSCLLAVDLFKQLGSTQVGEATNVSQRYMEVRQIVLPSGLTKFSTLQKVSLGDGNFGPYAPDVAFTGRMNDTASLRSWIRATFGASVDSDLKNAALPVR